MKDLFWVGSSRDELNEFPDDARRMAGHQLHRVQMGLEPDDWKPMPSVGAGVSEIRIRTEVEHRVFYVAKFTEGVYVLHAFAKKTQRTRPAHVELGKESLQAVLAHRRDTASRAKKGRN